jgi:hypothetical protein
MEGFTTAGVIGAVTGVADDWNPLPTITRSEI